MPLMDLVTAHINAANRNLPKEAEVVISQQRPLPRNGAMTPVGLLPMAQVVLVKILP